MVKRLDENKVCVAASAGGHLSQLLKLGACWKGKEVVYITTNNVVKDRCGDSERFYVIDECNREHPIKVFKTLIRCINILVKEKPATVISTGAAPGCLTCMIGKMMGAKVIWIDSIANVNRLSMSGKIIRHVANLFLVQWPALVSKYPNVEFRGTLI